MPQLEERVSTIKKWGKVLVWGEYPICDNGICYSLFKFVRTKRPKMKKEVGKTGKPSCFTYSFRGLFRIFLVSLSGKDTVLHMDTLCKLFCSSMYKLSCKLLLSISEGHFMICPCLIFKQFYSHKMLFIVIVCLIFNIVP